MDCSCDNDGEPLDFMNTIEVRARKAHTCSDCGGGIQPGERYQLITFKLQCADEIETYKTCADCRHLVAEVGRTFYEDCGGWQCVWWGNLTHHWDSVCCDIADDGDMVRLAGEAQRIVAMQHAACEARGGNRKWTLPRNLTAESIRELQDA